MDAELKIPHNIAKKVRENAYAAYSNYQVGVALKVKESDEWFAGCNVENVTNGASACAEYGALMSCVAKLGPNIEIEALYVVTGGKITAPPCGVCLQFLNEFTKSDFPVYLADPNQVVKTFMFSELLPQRYVREIMDS